MSKKRKTGEVPELAQGMDGLAADNRRKKSAASRIGRACDRCQHRKLACDPAPEGCPPCQKVNAWCTVTDPLTGTPTYRGEFEYLEKRVEKQQRDIKDLLAKLRSLGQDIEYFDEDTPDARRYNAWKAVKNAGDTRPWDRDERAGQPPKNSGPPPMSATRSYGGENGQGEQSGALGKGGKELTDMPSPLAPETYVGLATARGHPVSSRLNMFGWEIDLANFTTPDGDDPKYPAPGFDHPIYDKSYRSGQASIYGIQQRLEEPKLPSKDEMLQYATILIQVLNVYTPALHKNKFLAMVNHVLDNPQAAQTKAQKVILHMSYATIIMHQAVRNQQDEARMQMNAMADQHYHYCLGHFGDLLAGDSLEDIQALALICLYTRNFPKPEMCWTVSHSTLARLIELSWHRAPRKKRRDTGKLSVYEVEMQKRLFWVVLTCVVVTSGKLGRPMPLRSQDFDVDYPESIPDDALSESGVDEQISQTQPCEFQPHIELCKLTPIYLDVCSTIYTAKRGTQSYKAFVEETEQRLKSWQAQWPEQYKKSCDDESIHDMDRMSIAFLNFFMFELRLLIHHPSLTMAKGGRPNHDDLRVCLSVSHGMLQYVKQMQRMRALECTWHACALFMLAIQTTLYAYGTLKEEITSAKFDECRQDMTAWLSIIGDMGTLLGSKNKLQQKVGEQVRAGIAQLHMVVQSKIALANKLPKVENAIRAEVKVEEVQYQQSNGHPQTPQMQNAAYAGYNGGMTTVNGPTSTAQANYGPGSSGAYQDLQGYQTMPQQNHNYPYPNPSTSVAAGNYSSAGTTMPYQNVATSAAYGLQQMAHHPHPSASPVSPYTSQSQQNAFIGNGYYQNFGQQGMHDPATTWLQYAQTLNSGLMGSPHSSTSGHTAADYQPAAASALLQLGNATAARDNNLMGAGDMSNLGMGNVANYGAVTAAQQWPLGFMEDARNGFDQHHG